MKKILLVNECSVLSTGYSKYGRSLLQGLYDSGKYEVAELATCIDPADEKRQHLLAELSNIPWKIYFNHPKKEEKQAFEANPINQFGAFKFNEVCLDFKPDCVLSIRDFWMEEWISSSPFRHIFKWIWMPTCDACFVKGTHIITNTTIKNIEDVVVGDLVLTHDGTYQNVLKTFINQNNKQILKIICNNVLPIELTEDHPVLVIERRKQKYTHNTRIHRSINHRIEDAVYKQANKLKSGDYLIVPKNKQEIDIKQIDITKFININYKLQENYLIIRETSQLLNRFIEINHDVLKLFGWYIAEGSVCKSNNTVSFALNGETEQEYLLFIESTLKKYFNINSNRRLHFPKDKSEEVIVNNKILSNLFGSIFGLNAYTKSIPSFIIHLPPNKIISFLEGIFCGDGSDTNTPHNKRQISYSTVSKTLAIQIWHLLLKLNILSSLNKYKNIYKISINGYEGEKLAKLFNWENNKFSFDGHRNNKSWIDSNGNAILRISNIQIGQKTDTVYNFEVEKNHTYITSFTVHNCPQNYQWLHIYSECDALLSYTDWAGELMQKQAGGKINYIGSAPSNIRPNFLPLDNSELKQSWGLSQYRILGTVMRNQRRKLFPDLFEGFRLFLDKSHRTDVLLYAHTSYPDWGWNFPDLLQKYNLSNRVLFTYICENCRYAFPSFFKDSISYCPKCKKMAAGLTGPNRGVSDDVLCRIYNLFDYYIQYANSEGEGVPQLEAAACGIPLIAINYSGMNDVISKIDGCKLQPLSFYNELETGCYRAIPDNKELSDKLVELFDLPNEEYQKLRTSTLENFRYHYSFDKTVGTWMKAIDSLDNANWNAPPKLSQLDSNPPKGDNTVFAKWLICNVLGEPERLGSYMHLRLLRDLNWGISEGGTHGMYYNEDSSLFQQKNYKEFNRKIAYQHFASMSELRNRWENIRCQQH